MDDWESEWQRKGATLSDKTAREEFGLTQDDIVRQSGLERSTTGEAPCTETPGCGFSGEKWKLLSSRSTGTTILQAPCRYSNCPDSIVCIFSRCRKDRDHFVRSYPPCNNRSRCLNPFISRLKGHCFQLVCLAADILKELLYKISSRVVSLVGKGKYRTAPSPSVPVRGQTASRSNSARNSNSAVGY